jgi:hypothetical protein
MFVDVAVGVAVAGLKRYQEYFSDNTLFFC